MKVAGAEREGAARGDWVRLGGPDLGNVSDAQPLFPGGRPACAHSRARH